MRPIFNQKAYEAFKPYFDRGSVIEEMSDHLTKPQVTEAQRLVTEYTDARIDQLSTTTGGDAPRRMLVMRAKLESFGRQIVESIDRQVGLQQDQFEQLAEQLSLTEEQKQRIEAIYQPIAIERFQGKRNPKAEAAAIFRVWEILNPKQRRNLMKIRFAGEVDQ